MRHGNRVLVADFAASTGVGATLATMLRESLLEAAGVRHEPCSPSLLRASSPQLSDLLRDHAPRVTLWVLTPDHGPEFTQLVRRLDLRLCQHLVVTETHDPSLLYGHLQSGVCDFILPPLDAADVIPRVQRAMDLSARPLPAQLEEGGAGRMIGQSTAFLQEIGKISMMSRCDATVLILGETGTGKELCARNIHQLSARADKPFVTVNCGAIPLDLLENELFGHEREAFTGAGSSRGGVIREAEGGTIFLDEIDSLSLVAQVKLLRFLQEKEIRPLGSARTVKVDVRVLAATNADPDDLIERGKLRRDLYYRIHVLSLRLPPLRDRRGDIPLLLEFFLARYCGKSAGESRRDVEGFTSCALQKLMLYSWPGNVRELEHVVERAVLLATGKLISAREILLSHSAEAAPTASFQEAKARLIDDFEWNFLTTLLRVHRGNVSRAAESARKNRRAFFQLLQKHSINASSFRGVP